MSIIARQKQLIENLQLKLERCANPDIFPREVSSQESTAHTLNLAIAGLKTLLSIPVAHQISDNLIKVGVEHEHVFDVETYNLLRDIVNTALESPDQAQYQLKLLANILGLHGHQIQS